MKASDRVNPWYSTETWSGWFDVYGDGKDVRKDVFTLTLNFMGKALAWGANGFNFYMVHGGTNFDYWNNNQDAATYDYGAAIGQAGDLRRIYYQMKKYNTFATSFADILETATGDHLDEFKTFATNGHVLGVRKSPNGTIVFVQGGASPDGLVDMQAVGEGSGGSIHLPYSEVAGIVLDATLVPAPNKISLIEAVSSILGIAHHGSTTTLIVYGKPGDTGVLTLGLGDTKTQVQVSYPEGSPTETLERVGTQTLRILALSSDLEPNTWIAGAPGKQSVVVGPQYLGDFNDGDGKPFLTIERFFGHDAPSQVLVYGDASVPATHLAVTADKSMDTAPAPDLTAWQVSAPRPEIQPDFDDSTWMASENPTQMGADGDITSYAWYRTVVQAPVSGLGTLHFDGAADHLMVYVNGKRVHAKPSQAIKNYSDNDILKNGQLSWDAMADFQAGDNSVAVFVSHQGRDKVVSSGPLNNYYPKGIFKPVTLKLGDQTLEVKKWKMHGGIPAVTAVSFNSLDSNYSPSQPEFFQAIFTAKPPGAGGANPMFWFFCDGLSRGSLFLNGHNLGRYPDVVKLNGKPVPLYLPECWLNPSGRNSLVVFDEEGQSPARANSKLIRPPAAKSFRFHNRPIPRQFLLRRCFLV